MKTKMFITSAIIILFSIGILGCKKDKYEEKKVNNFIGKSWISYIPKIRYYKFSFISDTECYEEYVNVGGVSYSFMNYTYDKNNGVITNPNDGCSQHKLTITGSDLIISHDNGHTNWYHLVN